MRPTTPNFKFARQAGPSSPPATPTAATFNFNLSNKKSRRQGIPVFNNFPPIPSNLHTNGGTITPNGSGPTFSYNRFEPLDLSPRSSSPASSRHSSSSDDDSIVAPRSRSVSPAKPIAESPPKKARVIVKEGNFILEEFGESDYEEFDSDCESVLRPHQYEDAESEKARSTRASTPKRVDLDDGVVNGLRDLDWGAEDNDLEQEHIAWLEKRRLEKRQKRRSSSSFHKRSLAQSIGSDTDDEDLQPVTFDANEAGSSARRLRRKVGGERTSLIFDDPPVGRIEEVDEPESCAEGVAIGIVEEESDDESEEEEQQWEREMPFYGQEDMDLDSDTSEDDSEDEE